MPCSNNYLVWIMCLCKQEHGVSVCVFSNTCVSRSVSLCASSQVSNLSPPRPPFLQRHVGRTLPDSTPFSPSGTDTDGPRPTAQRLRGPYTLQQSFSKCGPRTTGGPPVPRNGPRRAKLNYCDISNIQLRTKRTQSVEA